MIPNRVVRESRFRWVEGKVLMGGRRPVAPESPCGDEGCPGVIFIKNGTSLLRNFLRQTNGEVIFVEWHGFSSEGVLETCELCLGWLRRRKRKTVRRRSGPIRLLTSGFFWKRLPRNTLGPLLMVHNA